MAHAITPTSAPDEDLVAAVAGGDRAALAALYDRHAAVIYGLARRVLRDEGRSEEVLQDVFVALWQRAETFESARGSVLTWLVAITRSRAIDRLRREQSRPTGHGVPLTDARWSPEVADEQSVSDPARVADQHERAEQVRNALRHVPDAQRRTIELAFFGGLSQREIAERTDVPLGTVKTRMHHGMRHLRELLDSAELRDV
jgi:RNA polymerase sigma-70 factor (ECF subfamily)